MYVTRPLSLYNSFPAAASEPPPEGPNSGVLVVEDEAAEAQARCCFGLCRNSRVYGLPFSQNREIEIRYSSGVGENSHTYYDKVFFIPAVGEPLSSNRYYVIRAHGKHKGKTCTCSRKEDKSTFLFLTFTNDIDPSPFDHGNIYQQVEIVRRGHRFRAKSVASDGIPQKFLRRDGWRAYADVPTNCTLGEALGLNHSLRTRMPDLNLQISTKCSPPVDVGKWYCPFIFVKEAGQLKDQMRRSMYYEMTLKQFWEEVYTCENYGREEKAVEVAVSVVKEMALLNGTEVVSHTGVVDGVIWFKSVNNPDNGIGLSLPIWERMRWEEERGGWVGGHEEKVERVERIEVYEGQERVWNKFGCYMLVERFVLKRMDTRTALTYDFKHTDKIRVKWE